MFTPFRVPLRLISPCQALPVTDIEQRITAGAAGLLGPLRAIPGITAGVRGVTVDCAAGVVRIPILMNYRAGGLNVRAFVSITCVLEPLPLAAVSSPFTPICVTVRARFIDLVELPLPVQQQVETVIRMIFTRTLCFAPPRVIG